MPVLVVRLEPWLAAQTYVGEPVPDRWRRLGAEAGFDVFVDGPGAVGDGAVVDGHALSLEVDDLRSLAEGTALVLEEPDADDEERTELGEDRTLPRIRRTPTAAEHGLVVAAPAPHGARVGTTDAVGPARGLVLWWNVPIRTPAQLVQRERQAMTVRLRRELDRGVRLVGEGQFVAPGVELEPGCTIGPNVVLLGRTRVAAGAAVQTGCHLVDVEVGPGAWLKPFVVAEGARIEAGVQVGPFAHLREATVLETGARIGNFVETKKATVGVGAKANHLAYLGDCAIGDGANVGAGTITCNYDGAAKHFTRVGAGAFVGTNTSLVAPITIGDGALVAAGSVVTEDVPPGGLAVARAEQRTTPDKGRTILERNRRRKQEKAG